MSTFLRILLVLAVLAPWQLLAQAPAGINYQAVARDTDGEPLANQLISVRFALKDGAPTGTEIFAETHTGINTNDLGLFTLTIGEGANITGDLSTIDWGTADRFLTISIDENGGSSFTELATIQLLSVPYALHAQTAAVASTLAPGAGDNWGTQTVETNGLVIGNGTIGNPVELGGGAATNGQVLQWNGTDWAPATVGGGVGDNWGSQVAQTAGAIAGSGDSGDPIQLIDGLNADEILVWNGTDWNAQAMPAGDNWGTQTVQVTANTPITGNGTSANPIDFVNGTATGQVLTWDGTSWSPAAPAAGATYTGTGAISVSGTTISLSNGTTNGDVLTWNGTNWIAQQPTGGGVPYSGGTGIAINASNVISNTDPGSALNLTGGTDINVTGTYPNLTVAYTGTGGGGSYTAGNGIAISGGNVISNNAWTVNANGVVNNTDNIGVGTTNPIEFLNVVGGNFLVEGGGSYVANNGGNDRVEAFVTTDDAGEVNIFGPAGNSIATMRSQGAGFANLGAIAAMEDNGFETATMFGDSAGALLTRSVYGTGSNNLFVGWQPGNPDRPRMLMFSNEDAGGNPQTRINMGVAGGGNDFGYLEIFGPNNNSNVFLGIEDAGFPNEGGVYIADDNGLIGAGLRFDPATGDAEVFGDVKNFRTAHPTKPGKDIVYASLEGPEAAAYFRGTATLENGKAEISFPEHFRHIASNVNMTVVLTPLDASSKGLAVTQKSLEKGIVVQELMNGNGNYSFDYEVKTVRKGYADYQVVRDQIEIKTPQQNNEVPARYKTPKAAKKSQRANTAREDR